MKSYKLITLLSSILLFYSCSKPGPKSITEYVNPFIGTGGHGHTYPGASLPFGMVQLSPDSRLEGWDGCSGYHYSDSVIYGFSHTHLSGTGVSDYGDVLLMPIQGDIVFNNGASTEGKEGYASLFQKKNEKASPGYYEVLLDKHQIKVRLTTTTRVGIHEYSFTEEGTSHLILDLEHRDELLDDSISIINHKEVVGKRISKAWAQKQHIYFVMQFSKEFESFKLNPEGTKASFTFDTKANESMLVKVGISATSIEGARKNLESEAHHWNFDEYLKEANRSWEKALSKIEIEDEDENKKSIFYTALYHSLLAPNTFSDVDGSYRGMDGKVHQSKETVYTVFSLWDTFRATHPLFAIIERNRSNDFIKTFLKQYLDGGELPIWELAGNYTGCMIGYHAIPVIADAYAKGIRDYDTDLALEAMLHSAMNDKLGLEAYKNKGYIEVSDEAESVSKTLEYAYDDWCIAQMANWLGKDQVYEEFIQRAQYYKNIFNPEVGFMQSKMNAAWTSPFNPSEVNFNFTEANSWQYSMFAPQDISGLIELYGGPDAFEAKLDSLFTADPNLKGRQQVDITGLIGQYAHGNEPSHHMAYLYNYMGKPYKTQARVNQILNELYSTEADGLSGNEDCGQMSSWYVLSSMGFYSVSPGLNQYAIGSPQFDKVTIHLENGNSFSIKSNKQTENSYYIQNASLNGKEFNQSYLDFEDLMAGGILTFELGEKPNPNWAAQNSPLSMIPEEDQLVAVPYFNASSPVFTDSLLLEIKAVDQAAQIFYRLNEDDFVPYKEAFYINADAKLEAYASLNDKKSFTVSASYKKIDSKKEITLLSSYSNQYAAGGNNALIDFQKGGTDFRNGFWQGFYNRNFSAIVSLDEAQLINEISIGALQDIKSWIWFPKSISLAVSMDGKSYRHLTKITNDYSDTEYGGISKEFSYKADKKLEVKYMKIEAENYGNCPAWHPGNGNPTWLFFDEISIK